MVQPEIDGIWAAEFRGGPLGDSGTGVIILLNGSLLGGDTSYYYKGNYTLKVDKVSGQLTVNHHSGERSSIFGPLTTFSMSFDASYGDPWIMGQLRLPNVQFSAAIKLRRLERFSGGTSP